MRNGSVFCAREISFDEKLAVTRTTIHLDDVYIYIYINVCIVENIGGEIRNVFLLLNRSQRGSEDKYLAGIEFSICFDSRCDCDDMYVYTEGKILRRVCLFLKGRGREKEGRRGEVDCILILKLYVLCIYIYT